MLGFALSGVLMAGSRMLPPRLYAQYAKSVRRQLPLRALLASPVYVRGYRAVRPVCFPYLTMLLRCLVNLSAAP